MRAVRRGIDSLEELERVEREEAAEEERLRATAIEAVPTSSELPNFSDDFTTGWDGVFQEVDLDPLVLAQFDLTGGRSLVPPSGSSGGQ